MWCFWILNKFIDIPVPNLAFLLKFIISNFPFACTFLPISICYVKIYSDQFSCMHDKHNIVNDDLHPTTDYIAWISYVHYDNKKVKRKFSSHEEQNKSMKSFYVHYLLLQLDIHDNYDLIYSQVECKGNYPWCELKKLSLELFSSLVLLATLIRLFAHLICAM